MPYIQKYYYVYLLRCADGSYYTGITNNVDRRLEEHNAGINPESYTHNRRPVELVYEETYKYVLDAIAREKQIKGWSRAKKEAMINSDWRTVKQLSHCQNETHYANKPKESVTQHRHPSTPLSVTVQKEALSVTVQKEALSVTSTANTLTTSSVALSHPQRSVALSLPDCVKQTGEVEAHVAQPLVALSHPQRSVALSLPDCVKQKGEVEAHVAQPLVALSLPDCVKQKGEAEATGEQTERDLQMQQEPKNEALKLSNPA